MPLGEPVAQEEEERDAGDGVDAVGDQEADERQLHQAGREEDRRPDARRDAGEEQDADAIVVKVLFDLLQPFRRQAAVS